MTGADLDRVPRAVHRAAAHGVVPLHPPLAAEPGRAGRRPAQLRLRRRPTAEPAAAVPAGAPGVDGHARGAVPARRRGAAARHRQRAAVEPGDVRRRLAESRAHGSGGRARLRRSGHHEVCASAAPGVLDAATAGAAGPCRRLAVSPVRGGSRRRRRAGGIAPPGGEGTERGAAVRCVVPSVSPRCGRAGRSWTLTAARWPPRTQASRARSALLGRPRGRLRGTTTPRSKISPPHTPHGSSRCSAPARHARPDRAVAAERLGPLQLGRRLGEPQVGVARAAGQVQPGAGRPRRAGSAQRRRRAQVGRVPPSSGTDRTSTATSWWRWGQKKEAADPGGIRGPRTSA